MSSNNEFTTGAKVFCATVSEGWTWPKGQVCINDTVSSHILEGDTLVPLDNTDPATCTARCDAFGYTLAGVDFSAECCSGAGLTGFSPSSSTQ